MHIAMLAPISWRVPPRHYGPWELITSLLTEGLVAAGIEVTLFATLDSETSATLAGVVPRPYSEDSSLDAKVWECLHIAELFERADEFDLIHNQFDFLPLSYSGLVSTPVVTTIHGFSSERILPVYQKYNDSTHYVSISDADRHPSLSYAATVYHGIDLPQFTLRETPDDYLLYFGRIHPDKGTAEAIEVARRLDMRLILAGIVQDEDYFAREVAPHLKDGKIDFVGSVGPTQRDQLLGGARALLHLINFDEPFGLSMVEAMACGTPVIATPRGSIPEVVAHGATGFVVDDVEAAAVALAQLDNLDRRAIRQHVEHRFSREQMVRGYVDVYRAILK